MNSILLSKFLYKKAIELYSPVDELSYGLTVSLLQDSAEMLVWEMAKQLNVNIKPKDGFVSILENIDKNHVTIDLKPQIFELNTARVNFKHYGNIPSNTDVPKHIDSCGQFLKLNSYKINIDFDSLSSADTVSIPKIREHLKNSENQLNASNLEDALIETSIAFQELERIAYEKVGVDEYAINKLSDAYEAWPEECWDAAREFTGSLTEILEKTVQHISRGMFGYSQEHVSSIKSMCYQVNISVSGKVLGASNMGGVKLDKESIAYVNDFIVQASRRV